MTNDKQEALFCLLSYSTDMTQLRNLLVLQQFMRSLGEDMEERELVRELSMHGLEN